MIISVANNKGGVSKTTISLMLGKEAMQKRKRVLFIDLDEQLNLTYALTGKKHRGLFDISERAQLFALPVFKKVDMSGYDYVIIDNPPAINDRVKWSVEVADRVLIPMLMEGFSVIGLGEMLKIVDKEKVIVIPAMVQKGTRLHRDTLQDAKEYLDEEGIKVGKVIPRTIKIPEAIEEGKFYNLRLLKEVETL